MKKKGILYALIALLTFTSIVSMMDAGRNRSWRGRRYHGGRYYGGRRWGWRRPYFGLGFGSYYRPYYYGFPGIGFSIGF